MPRVKGSKNKPKTIESYESALDEEDLLNSPSEEIKESKPIIAVIKAPSKESVFLGYHPITGAEVWS